MSGLWLILLPLLLTDIANPVLFALLVYLSGLPRGTLLSCSVLAGHTAASFGSGIIIALGFEQLTLLISDPGPLSYGVGLGLGLLLLWMAWKSRSETPSSDPAENPPTSLGSAFVTGAIINFIGVPFALPYFAAIDQILKQGLSVAESLLALGGYNLAYMAPFLIVPSLVWTRGEDAQAVLQRLNEKVGRFAAVVLPLILGLVGVALTVDALLYFTTGKGLI